MKKDIFNEILKQYDGLKARIKDGNVDTKDLKSFLKTICDFGRKAKDSDQRVRLSDIALEIGEKIYEISSEFPDIELKTYDETFDLVPEIEQIRKMIESFQGSKSDLEKIKDGLDKIQKTTQGQDYDTDESKRGDDMSEIDKFKFELEINKLREALEKLQKSPSDKELENIKAELEKLKKPTADNKDNKEDQAMKSELEQIRKMIENSQSGKIKDIQDALEKIQKEVEKKPAPSGTSPDIQTLKESLEQIKKAMEGNKDNKIIEAIEKLKEAVEKKPAPPPPAPAGPSPDMQAIKGELEQIKKSLEGSKVVEAIEKLKEAIEKKPPPPPGPSGPSPDTQALKSELEQIKKLVEATQIEPIKIMTIISLVVCILIFFGLIWGIAMSFSINKTMEEMRDELFPRKGKKISQAEPSDKTKKVVTEKKDINLISLKSSESVHVLSGQVVIRLVKIKDKSVNIELTLPNMKVYSMEDMKVGTRTRFECDSETYFLDLVKISNDSAKIKVQKRA